MPFSRECPSRAADGVLNRRGYKMTTEGCKTRYRPLSVRIRGCLGALLKSKLLFLHIRAEKIPREPSVRNPGDSRLSQQVSQGVFYIAKLFPWVERIRELVPFIVVYCACL